MPLRPPAALLDCAAEPLAPDTADQDVVALYLLDLASAGEDCRARLRAVRRFVEGASVEQGVTP